MLWALPESASPPIPIAAAANNLYKLAKSHDLHVHDFLAVIGHLEGNCDVQNTGKNWQHPSSSIHGIAGLLYDGIWTTLPRKF